MKTRKVFFLLVWLAGLLLFSACGLKAEQPSSAGRLRVVATTTIVADVVLQVGADRVDLGVLLPVGSDPHSFEPTPQEIAKVAAAEVVFANGGGLEEFLANLIESAGAQDRVHYVSDGVNFLETGESDHGSEADGTQEQAAETGHQHGVDPHTWTDPNNVRVWVQNIENTLTELDPANAEAYQANAEAYLAELEQLDAWIREQVSQVPAADRKIVSDHGIFGYYAQAYGFEQVGTLIPGYSTLAEPSAQELAKIEDAIRDVQVKAIYVGKSVNPSLAARVAADTGIQLIYIYTGSLSEPGGEAGTYLDYMRYNTNAFVEPLK